MVSYAIVVEPISEEDGGGFMAFFPDLPGCMSDGESPEEVVKNSLDALDCWRTVQLERGSAIPEPGAASVDFAENMEVMNAEIKRLAEELKTAQDRVQQLGKSKTQGWQFRRPKSEYSTKLAFG